MSVDADEARRIAELAKLSLDDGEADRLAEEMNRILEHAERLRSVRSDVGAEEVETGEAPPDPGSIPDTLAHGLAGFAPQMHDGFFTVPPPPGVVGSDS